MTEARWRSLADVNAALQTARVDTPETRAFVDFEIAAKNAAEASDKASRLRRDLERAEEVERGAKNELAIARERVGVALNFHPKQASVGVSAGDRNRG